MKKTRNGNLGREALSNSDRMEMLGCIIDVFEDFLEERGIVIENEEKDGDDSEAIIYGSDYDLLTSGIEAVLIGAGLLDM